MYRVGIIGCGRIASGFEEDAFREHPCTHAGAFTKHPSTQVIAAAETDEDLLKKFGEKWGVNNIYSDYKEMLQKEKLDIVSICTPEQMHAQMVIDAAKSGVKLIFCEKPIAVKLTDAKQMLEACKQSNVKLVINHTRRWHTNYLHAKELVDGGAIGAITSITGRYTSGLRVMGTHLLDILRYYCGDAVWVIGEKETTQIDRLSYSENYNKDDPAVSGIMKFRDGCIGLIEGTCLKSYLLFEIELDGTDGRMIISDNGKTLKLFKKKENKQQKGLYELTEAKIEKKEYTPMMLNAVADIIGSLERNEENISSGVEGYKALEIIEALLKSAEINEVVHL